MADPRPEPLVYRVPDVCRLLQISPAHLYRLIQAERVPALRYGRSLRIPAWWVREQVERQVA